MNIIYLDCYSGISGDMFLGALVDWGVPLQVIQTALASLPIEGYELQSRRVRRGGVAATKVDVVCDDHQKHPHRGLNDVLEILRGGDLDPSVLSRSADVFRNLAEAEAHVHDSDPNSIHFHEVGAVDAICDIVGTVVGLNSIGAAELLFSTVSLGGGVVEAEHGTLPVPAPATVELLKGLPTAGGPVDLELATPTGAALISTLGKPMVQWPEMQLGTMGHGAGSREIDELPNLLRLVTGETATAGETESDHVWSLEVNLDDMTGEEVGYCRRLLLAEGVLDVFTTPIQMKKDRPGIKMTVLCAPQDLNSCEELIFRNTTTLGIRRTLMQRSKLSRRVEDVATRWGEARVKVAAEGGETDCRVEPEYEDCARIARKNDLPLRQVYQRVREAWEEHGGGNTQKQVAP